ncbi:uncharacterized protein KGF55_001301 [Candida pseudojiufengensis]|uniref:uncharacterized protein n=1 Tax=Candida pseudojiufengensis TaxID=497109 RepID=UPI00222493D9|nr:uncharacterized protein KGF55_001301 [Candida pseudojiufengensis]KAI5965937.1 hypothetical protein KGF55_001301 [Candida pseudojiufengensis]
MDLSSLDPALLEEMEALIGTYQPKKYEFDLDEFVKQADDVELARRIISKRNLKIAEGKGIWSEKKLIDEIIREHGSAQPRDTRFVINEKKGSANKRTTANKGTTKSLGKRLTSPVSISHIPTRETTTAQLKSEKNMPVSKRTRSQRR